MTYYWTCPYCGANLDPGERCDCREGGVSEAESTSYSRTATYRIMPKTRRSACRYPYMAAARA